MSERDPDAPRDPTPSAPLVVPFREIVAGGGAEPEPARPGSAPHGRPDRPRRIPRPFVPALPRPRPISPDEPDTPPTEHGQADRLAARRTAPLRGGRGLRGLVWLVALLCGSLASANTPPADDVVIHAGGRDFTSWREYTSSPEFTLGGLRCQAPARDLDLIEIQAAADCSYNVTNPSAQYAPSSVYRIPVVFHVIQRTNGTGYVSPTRVAEQIAVLNEDFRALAGTPGAPGVDTAIEFVLAGEDPAGNPHSGITYSTNNTWYNDSGSYWTSLAWDPSRYINIYTNGAGGALGYVPGLPQQGTANKTYDRVVLLHSTVGFNAPIGSPYNKGRTATHEIGHFLGLFHTFDGGCGSVSGCYTSGDLICDTNRESTAHFGCAQTNTCSSPDPIHNYMDYSDDTCMWEFTEEQARRMRCTLESYRAQLFAVEDNAWADLGLGLPGLTTPVLSGNGSFAPGSTVTLTLTGGLPFGAAFLVLGLAQVDAPFKGGTLVPRPDLVVPGVPLDGTGGFSNFFTLPASAPSGLETFWQVWSPDGFAPVGFASSNGLQATVP